MIIKQLANLMICFEVEESGDYFPAEADVIATFAMDTNYGADADGNRGINKKYLECLTISEVRVTTNTVAVIYGESQIKADWYSEIWDRVEEYEQIN